MQVRFSDETALYDFSTAEITVTSYAPTVGKRGEASVTDSIEILIGTGNIDEQQAVKDELNNWLSLAVEQWETVSESRIFIEIKQTGESDWRRSEMLGGRLQPLGKALDSHSLYKQEYLLIIDRRNWWEWPEEEIELSIDNSGFATGGVLLTNGAVVVSVDPNGPVAFIAGGSITGDPQTPIPVRLEMTPVDTDKYLDRILIAHNVFATLDPLTDEHKLHGDEGLPDNSDTDPADSTIYNEIESDLGGSAGIEWELDTTQLAGLGGRWFRMLVRIKTTAAEAAVFGKFELFSENHVSENAMCSTERIFIADAPSEGLDGAGYDLIDFGAIRLPTISPHYDAWPLNLKFSADSDLAAEAGFTLWLDFVILAPVDSFHHIESTNTSAYAPTKIVADGRINKTYAILTDGDTEEDFFMDAYTDISPHISVWPGRSQWITILHRNTELLMEADHLLTLRAFYRPRRTTV